MLRSIRCFCCRLAEVSLPSACQVVYGFAVAVASSKAQPRSARAAGETFTAQRCHEMGLIWKVVPAGELEAETHALAERLAASGACLHRARLVHACTGRPAVAESVGR